jgi:hypothetical protein
MTDAPSARRLAGVAALAALLLLVGIASATTAAANAAVRYGAPDGTGQDPCANPNGPCPLATALGQDRGTTIARGDEVILAPGTYSGAQLPTESMSLIEGIDVHGVAGESRPVLLFDTPGRATSLSVQPGDHVSHLEIDGEIKSPFLLTGGVVEDVIARSANVDTFACLQRKTGDLLVRDSACLASGARSAAFFLDGGSTVDLRNVTAVATGEESFGIRYDGNRLGTGGDVKVNATAVIASGTDKDISAVSTLQAFHAEIDLDHSDYRTTETMASGTSSTLSITPAGSGTDVEGQPLLASDGYHQLPGSPTVDAGATDDLSGEFDLDGQPRTLGRAPDIGADEQTLPSATALQCQPSVLTAGANQIATCTATVLDGSGGGRPPSGRVRFESDQKGAFGGDASCLLAPTGGESSTCQIPYSPNAAGPRADTISAAFQGGPEHGPSRGTTTLQIRAPLAGPPTPPKTAILRKPPRKSTSPVATFTFASSQSHSRFQCKLDRKPFKPCRSPFTAKKLKPGPHAFQVRAVGPQGVADPTPAVYRWKVSRLK